MCVYHAVSVIALILLFFSMCINKCACICECYYLSYVTVILLCNFKFHWFPISSSRNIDIFFLFPSCLSSILDHFSWKNENCKESHTFKLLLWKGNLFDSTLEIEYTSVVFMLLADPHFVFWRVLLLELLKMHFWVKQIEAWERKSYWSWSFST